ncbi:DeoR/GlpR family DNA-binding transcription regulator [Neobacillus sp. 179-C4.2 HS]|uniref:DeoR/GlpR family DNA-binding transcription regulator n=1 Tax=Neobacillus driksii TaxID=3035913 RepID=A0ABV4YP99_9BACI|nr:DeoR/GlpR family DNA-binding transcription regulator [Neobacillus sp. 179.-C4.2 HS]MDP5195653.1 DeoR/GlpR family DNA-binding transcription regulator [Neobacillus sp. 179.-C4.2 HS]
MVTTVRQERQNKIIDYLRSEGFVKTLDLVEILNYSEATIKRDLVELEEKELIRRTRGGAMIIDKRKIDIPYLMKIDRFNDDKKKAMVTKIADRLLKDDMVIFIDSSSTALHLVDILTKYDGLQIITNGLITASLLSEYTTARVSIVGGSIVPKRYTINGSKALFDITTYYADIAFVSCRGYDFTIGATETMEGEAYIKQAFRKQSKEVALLITSDKINHRYMRQSLSNQDIDYIITDKKLSEDEINILIRNNIRFMSESEL